MVWPFSSGSSSSETAKDQDINRPSETHIAPPSGGSVPLPEPPKGYKSVAPPSQHQKAEEFKGFTPPPPKEVPHIGPLIWTTNRCMVMIRMIRTPRKISQSLPLRCRPKNPMGGKMGGAVGGIFGVLAGGYSMVAYRNFWYLPMSIIGGAASFGFFLGCGMIIRCEELPGARSELPAASADYRGPQHLMFYPIDGRYLSLKEE